MSYRQGVRVRDEEGVVWEFSTDPGFQQDLDWVKEFVRHYVEPLDLLYPDRAFDPPPKVRPIARALKQRVKDRGLWAYHLPPELGGRGGGQVKLCLLNEILGASLGRVTTGWGPVLFGAQAPDSGNAEILAHYGTEDQKAKYLQPLLEGDIHSCYSMTEPQGGADPGVFTTRARRDGDQWVISGEKWFASHATVAEFIIVMAITNPDVAVHRGSSMFLVPRGTPGLAVVRNTGTGTEPLGEGVHAYLRFDGARLPAESLLGGEGDGFRIAQARLSGGRIHHSMRTIAVCRYAFDMMCERALSRTTKGTALAEKQLVQQAIADTYIELQQFRLFVLYTAWLADQYGWDKCRKEVASTKVIAARVLPAIVQRAMQIHGSLGVSNEMPLTNMWTHAPWMGIMDGPTEVHLVSIARNVLRQYAPSAGIWPTAHLPGRMSRAEERFREMSAEFSSEVSLG
jgi:acyl-CoA dehydrogenase